jgi:hypothetical protein
LGADFHKFFRDQFCKRKRFHVGCGHQWNLSRVERARQFNTETHAGAFRDTWADAGTNSNCRGHAHSNGDAGTPHHSGYHRDGTNRSNSRSEPDDSE